MRTKEWEKEGRRGARYLRPRTSRIAFVILSSTDHHNLTKNRMSHIFGTFAVGNKYVNEQKANLLRRSFPCFYTLVLQQCKPKVRPHRVWSRSVENGVVFLLLKAQQCVARLAAWNNYFAAYGSEWRFSTMEDCSFILGCSFLFWVVSRSLSDARPPFTI